MFRRFAALVAALGIAFATLGAPAPALASLANGYCSNGTTNDEHFFMQRTAGTYDAARGQTTIHSDSPNACTGTTNGGGTFVMLATVQGNGNLAQCAWGQVAGFPMGYMYTPGNDGYMQFFPTQLRHQSGDVVVCTIAANTVGGWTYTLTNLTAGTHTAGFSSRAGSGGNLVWWGFEIGNTWDQWAGYQNFEYQISMIGYSTTTSSSWWYATNDNGGGFWCGCPVGAWEPWMYGWITVTGSPYYDVLHAYSTLH